MRVLVLYVFRGGVDRKQHRQSPFAHNKSQFLFQKRSASPHSVTHIQGTQRLVVYNADWVVVYNVDWVVVYNVVWVRQPPAMESVCESAARVTTQELASYPKHLRGVA